MTHLRQPARAQRLAGALLAFTFAPGLLAGSALAGTGQAHVIVIDAMKFKPAKLTVHRGDVVRWENKDIVPHTATASGKRKAFDSGTIDLGKHWKHVMKKKGTFDYECRFHPTMKGVIVVE